MLTQGACPHVGAARTHIVAATTSERGHGVRAVAVSDARELTPVRAFKRRPRRSTYQPNGKRSGNAPRSALGRCSSAHRGLDLLVRRSGAWLAPRPTAPGGESANGASPRTAYLQPGVVVVCPGGWHLALASFGPPPLLPGPNDGSASAAAGASAPSTPRVANATAMRFLIVSLHQMRVDETRRRSRDTT